MKIDVKENEWERENDNEVIYWKKKGNIKELFKKKRKSGKEKNKQKRKIKLDISERLEIVEIYWQEEEWKIL